MQSFPIVFYVPCFYISPALNSILHFLTSDSRQHLLPFQSEEENIRREKNPILFRLGICIRTKFASNLRSCYQINEIFHNIPDNSQSRLELHMETEKNVLKIFFFSFLFLLKSTTPLFPPDEFVSLYKNLNCFNFVVIFIDHTKIFLCFFSAFQITLCGLR